MLNTAQKIRLARLASRALVTTRKMVGQPADAEFVRQGIHWRLDLTEGIDLSIFLLGAFEPSTVRAYSAVVKPGQTVLDIGANIGAHTLPLAKLVGERGRVIAFEPTAFAFRKCVANVALNPALATRITLRQTMLVAEDSEPLPAAVCSSWPLVEAPDLHEQHRGRLKDITGATPATLDQVVRDLQLTQVHFIKLDVDGYEYPVLAGGRGTLRQFQPVIALELAPYIHSEHGHTFEELIVLLRELGYRFSDIATRRPIAADPSSLRKIIPEGGSINVLAEVSPGHG
jgi:FkbM family methyltransferase